MNTVFTKALQLQNNRYIKSLGPIGILALIVLFLFVFTPTFRSSSNLTQILLSAAVYMMMAMGMTFVIIIGGIDLSLGSIVGLAGGITCISLVIFQLPLWVGVLAGILVGVLCGVFNGFMVTKMGLIPFIATLGGQWIYRGALRLLNNGATITIRGLVPDKTLNDLSYLGNGRFLGLPIPVYIVFITAILLTFLLKKTVFGRSVYAIGSNAETARMSGINNNKITFLTFVLAGGLSGIAGVILTARMVSAQVNFGTGYEFEGIFASVVGGVSMAGGEGNVLGALIGALIVAVLRNGLNLNGINSFWQQVILGFLIVLVVYVDSLKTKRERAI